MSRAHALLTLLDVDDTLFDNDALEHRLRQKLARDWHAAGRDRFWAIFEQLRHRAGYADFLGAVERFRLAHAADPRVLELSRFLLDFPFAEYVYTGVPATIAHLQRFGPAVIVSDGDAVYQPYKIERSGIAAAVHGHVQVYIHKTAQIAEIERRYPAQHYLLVDDKLPILDVFKRAWGERVTTIQPLQGHYARTILPSAELPPADITIAAIGDLRSYQRESLIAAARA